MKVVYVVNYRDSAVDAYAALRPIEKIKLKEGMAQLAHEPLGCGSQEIEDTDNEGYRKIVFAGYILTYYVVDSTSIDVIFIDRIAS